MKNVFMTIDVEQDCPPRLSTVRGVSEGLPRLLDLFEALDIKATFFTTGAIAESFPELVHRMLASGHELACHGHKHDRFDRMNFEEAEADIKIATEILRGFDKNVRSFRAPNLRFPVEYTALLNKYGYKYDSSLCGYKNPKLKVIKVEDNLIKIPVTMVSQFLRVPTYLVYPIIKRRAHLNLLVHPWEFVNMRHTNAKIYSKFHTGEKALHYLKLWLELLKKEKFNFTRIGDFSI